ncbi:MAG: DUF4129 domain-containing protein, partial [Acidimicrobiia bacterium]
PDSEAVRSWRRFELVAIPVGVAALQMLSGSGVLVGSEFALAVGFGLVGWVLVNATLTDLDAIERAIAVTDGMTPLHRIRLRFTSVGVAAAGCAAVGAVGLDGFLDLSRPASASWSLAPLGYFLVGLAALGVTSRLAEERRWRRDGAYVEEAVHARWGRSVLTTVFVLGAAAFLVGSVHSGVTGLPVRALALTGRLGAWVTARAEGLRAPTEIAPPDRDQVDEAVSPPVPEVVQPEPVAEWLGDVALWVFIGLVFVLAVLAGRDWQQRIRTESVQQGVRFLEAARIVWGAVVDLLMSLWIGIVGLVRRVVRAPSDQFDAAPGVGGTGRPAWAPPDPIRSRIAAAYRRAVDAVSVAHDPPGRPETPREFAGRVEDPRLDQVTEAFEEARYSDHVLTESSAATAESAAAELDS